MSEIIGEALELDLGGGSIIVTPTGDSPVRSVNGKIGDVFVHTRETYPTLTYTQKEALRALMAQYYDVRERFSYEYNHGRNSFARKLDENGKTGCWNAETGKYKLNCNTFVQMIMMGRSAADFPADGSYSPTITKAFSFGYYADFAIRQKVGGLAYRDGSTVTGYYGFVAPNETGQNGDYTESFSKNSYYTGSTALYGQTLNTFRNANDLAYELYQLGCEIPLSELQIGDLVFTKRKGRYTDPVSAFYHERIFWRGIDHVVMVCGISAVDGSPVFMESTDYSKPIVRCGLNYSGDSDKLSAARHLQDAVMCARLPIAWGIPSNVPAVITDTKNAFELSQEVTT